MGKTAMHTSRSALGKTRKRGSTPGDDGVLLHATKEPEVVVVPRATYLTLQGRGAPEGPAFQAAIAAIYGVAYTLKYARKKAGRPTFKVPPLEGLWWVDGGVSQPSDVWNVARSRWCWKLEIHVPDDVTRAELEAAKRTLRTRRGEGASSEVSEVRLEDQTEGRSVQLLHVGPYATEPASIEKMRLRMLTEHLEPRGPHHEIYLSDPRRTPPEKARTILRQPVTAHHQRSAS
jgi:hypothetical protein